MVRQTNETVIHIASISLEAWTSNQTEVSPKPTPAGFKSSGRVQENQPATFFMRFLSDAACITVTQSQSRMPHCSREIQSKSWDAGDHVVAPSRHTRFIYLTPSQDQVCDGWRSTGFVELLEREGTEVLRDVGRVAGPRVLWAEPNREASHSPSFRPSHIYHQTGPTSLNLSWNP